MTREAFQERIDKNTSRSLIGANDKYVFVKCNVKLEGNKGDRSDLYILKHDGKPARKIEGLKDGGSTFIHINL